MVDEKIFELSSYDEETIKDLLWQVCYDFKNINEGHNQKYKSSKEAINYIINKCKESGINISFAGENSAKDTMEVDLGINNPIVVDVIVKRCYAAVYNENCCIEKVIKLLKTQDTGSNNSHKRIFGGLRELGFSAEEADYLKETCNLYPVALFLERLWDFSKKHQIKTNVDGSTSSKEIIEEKIISIPNIDNLDTNKHQINSTPNTIEENVSITNANTTNGYVNKNSLLNSLLQNEDSIEKIIRFFRIKEIKSIAELDTKIQETEKLLDSLLEVKEEILKLEQNGIAGEYIATKISVIEKLFSTINEF